MTDAVGEHGLDAHHLRAHRPEAHDPHPPALVATAPPTVALARAPQSTPKSSPAARAWRCNASIVTPAPAVTCAAGTSTGSRRVRPRKDSTTVGRSHAGTPPPTSPVLPPCGTIAAPAAAQAATTAATSASQCGRTTHVASPRYRPVQSTSYPARTSASVTTGLRR